MVNTFVSPVIGRASELGLGSYEDTEPVELRLNDSPFSIPNPSHHHPRRNSIAIALILSQRLLRRTTTEPALTVGQLTML